MRYILASFVSNPLVDGRNVQRRAAEWTSMCETRGCLQEFCLALLLLLATHSVRSPKLRNNVVQCVFSLQFPSKHRKQTVASMSSGGRLCPATCILLRTRYSDFEDIDVRKSLSGLQRPHSLIAKLANAVSNQTSSSSTNRGLPESGGNRASGLSSPGC